MAEANIDTRKLQKGSAEMVVLCLLEGRERHGYELARLIETRTNQALQFHVASLYPMLYRFERRGWVQGRWVEAAGERRKRYYRLTAEGRKMLALQRRTWRDFVRTLEELTGFGRA